jgi:2-hydroxy-6-oxonona-2,4-dienedioate hydrolase
MDSLDHQKLHFVDVQGTSTRYYEDGSGDPLVLIHGGHFGFVDALDMWSTNFAGLATRFHVYALDKLGQGHTDNPVSDADYTFEALFEHIVSWFGALGIRQAHVVGHSRGALAAACLGLWHPELVKSLVVVDSNTLAPDDSRYPTGDFYKAIGRRTPPGEPTLETVRIEPDANSHTTEHVSPDFLRRLLAIARLPKTQVAQEHMQLVEDSVWLPSLERKRRETLSALSDRGLNVPVLVIWGRNDPSAPLPLGVQLFERFCARTAEAELHVLNRAGHYSYREQPAAFNRVLTSFCLDRG